METNATLNKDEDIVVYLPGTRVEHVTQNVEQIMGRGNGCSIPVHIGTNYADKEITTAIVETFSYQRTVMSGMQCQLIVCIIVVYGNNRIDTSLIS